VGVTSADGRSNAVLAAFEPAKARRNTLALAAGVVLPTGVFAALAAAVAGRGGLGWDRSILRFFDGYYRHTPTSPLEVLLNVTTWVGGAIVLVAVVVLWKVHRSSQAAFLAVAVGGSLVFDLVLKTLLERRPLGDPSGGYSFPSGNAMASLAIVLATALVSTPRWRRRTLVVGVPAVLAYGTALAAQWWHYPSDIIGGWCLALAWVNLLWLVQASRRCAVATRRQR
jgi:membrane-associated phospholipid phosphatase